VCVALYVCVCGVVCVLSVCVGLVGVWVAFFVCVCVVGVCALPYSAMSVCVCVRVW